MRQKWREGKRGPPGFGSHAMFEILKKYPGVQVGRGATSAENFEFFSTEMRDICSFSYAVEVSITLALYMGLNIEVAWFFCNHDWDVIRPCSPR